MPKLRWVFVIGSLSALLAGAAEAGPINPGFESGDLTGWVPGGNGSALVTGAFAGLTPTEGVFFALVSSGPSDVGGDNVPDSASLTSLPFVVADPGGLLSLSFNFLTADFLDDSYEISLTRNGSTTTVLASGTVGSSTLSPTPLGFAVAPDGSTFVDQTGFITLNTQLLAGLYTLQFVVSDDFDGGFDSGLLIDNITVVEAPIPEPGTLLLLTGGLAALRVRSRRRSKDVL
jgi:hypothetical protein